MTADNLFEFDSDQIKELRGKLVHLVEARDIDSQYSPPSPTFYQRPLCTPLPTDIISRTTSTADLTKLASHARSEEKVGGGHSFGSVFNNNDHEPSRRGAFTLEEEETDDDEMYEYTETYTADFRQKSPVECLPIEIFDQIMSYLVVDEPTNGYTPRNRDLAACLQVSRTFHCATLSTLYAHVTFPHSYIFSKFLNHMSTYPELGELVRKLDFSTFTSVGLGRTKKMNAEIDNLTDKKLVKCLKLTPRLQEFLASEAIEQDISAEVLDMLFCQLPMLKSVDFCGSADKQFVTAVGAVLNEQNPNLPADIQIRRVGFHGCPTLPPPIFMTLLPRLSRLTHLDLSHTQITDPGLWLIPETARLTHLSLSRCNRLKGHNVVKFLTEHPAARNLIVLHLLYETSKYRLINDEDVDDLLPRLPKTLRVLNISGAKIQSCHVPLLRRLAKQLEELSIGFADLSIDDVNTIITPGYGTESWNREGKAFTERLMSSFSAEEAPQLHNLKYLDLTGVACMTPANILYLRSCALLSPASYPLRVIEFSERTLQGLSTSKATEENTGWVVHGLHKRRGWFVRKSAGKERGGKEVARLIQQDDGWRSWKMGGHRWGNRKIGPVAGELQGIYAYYSFGK